jgi:3',5'-cyclic AMP phosphodiesterase CpdA
MPDSAIFLHLTDTHLATTGTPFPRDDHKIHVPGIDGDTREAVLDLTLSRLAERLTTEGRTLDGVIFSGDAQDRGKPGGHQILLDLLIKHLGKHGVTAANIVAVPGNHDVPRGSPPGSTERYEAFTNVWRKAGCVTPWLDGIDTGATDGGPHCLVSPDGLWAFFAVNTCNWSHVALTLPEPLSSAWPGLPTLLAGGDAETEKRLREQLDGLAQYDMARVSSRQLEVLRGSIERASPRTASRQVRIVVLHHHLRAPSLREELKALPDISNLEQVRGFLRDREVALVIHGHKHEHAVYFDHIYDQDGDHEHRTLVIAGATLDAARENNAVRLIGITGMPNNPSITIEAIPIPRGGVDPPSGSIIAKRIWVQGRAPGAPVVIEGTDLDEVYDRVRETAAKDAANGMLIVHLDLPLGTGGELPLPSNYPFPESVDPADRTRWIKELVEWWQLDRSAFEHRMPFIHGGRLRRYGGKINQIDRIKRLLNEKSSTRAVAVLLDPFRDFTPDGQNEEFASFCLVEFKRRQLSGSHYAVDAIAFYRAQEFAQWWPINLAEIRLLQWEICAAPTLQPGRITTITGDARTYSRSPTQVAMPIIDRWLDEAPERLYLLADALIHRQVRVGAQRDAVLGWEHGLADLKATAEEYNPDGVPIAIEGLRVLASYLEASDDSTLDDFSRVLLRLARDNETYERGDRLEASFRRWATGALEAVSELMSMTSERLRR